MSENRKAGPLRADRRKRRTWTSLMPGFIGISALVFLGLAGGLWGTQTRISGAVLGKGKVQSAEQSTAVQHPIGGVVKEILAHNGERVTPGQVVIRLDDTDLRSKLAIVEGQLAETLATEARLDAILSAARSLTLHPLLENEFAAAQGIASLIERQRKLLATHYQSLETESGLLDQQAEQVRKQIAGIDAELAALSKGAEIVETELVDSQALFDKNLVKHSVYYQQQKELNKIRGDIGRLEARRAELHGKIAEIELRRHTLEPKAQQLAIAELARLRVARVEHLDERLALLNEMSQLDIRAPIGGVIHESKVAGVQSVVLKAATLMYIVPDEIPVIISVQIDSRDIDQVHYGQEVALRFEAFSRRETPLILGQISSISPDALLNPTTKRSYYDVQVTFREGEQDKLGDDQPLIAGMPVNAFISTEARTPLNYVTGPLMTYLGRAFRDG